MKYILYCRKSTDSEDRQLLSLDAQERELLEIADKYGLQVVATYRESMSAKSIGRPVFAKVIKEIKSGKADAILCWKLDRLARNFQDGGLVIDMLQKSIIKEIKTYEATHYPSDPVYTLAFLFGEANQYSRNLSVNVKRGNREKLERGEFPNKAPIGYLNDKATKKIVIDKQRAVYIKRVFDLYVDERKSTREIADILYSDGFRTYSGKKVYKSAIARILATTFYMGIMVRNNKHYVGVHTPLISKEKFEQARMIAEGKTQVRTQKLFFPLRGFLTCANCGCALTATLKKGHQYYYCTNGKKICAEHKKYLREEKLYPVIAEILTELAFSKRKIDLTYKAGKERVEIPNSYNEAVIEKLKKDLENIPIKESKLLDTFLEDSITKEAYDSKVLKLKNEAVDIKVEISRLEKQKPVNTLEPVRKLFEQGITMRNEFIDAKDPKKYEILKSVLWNLTIKGEKIITKQYKSPYDIIARTPKNVSIPNLLGYKDSNLDTQDQNLMSYH